MNAEEWFDDFYRTHLRRFSGFNWPAGEGFVELSESFRWHIEDKSIPKDIAFEASLRLMGEPVKNISFGNMLPRFLEIATEMKTRRSETNQANATLQYAATVSKGCLDCGGSGMTDRVSHKDGHLQRFFCNLCAMGVYLAQANRNTKLGENTPDLSDDANARLRMRECGDGRFDSPFKHQAKDWDAERDALRTALYELPPEAAAKKIALIKKGLFAGTSA